MTTSHFKIHSCYYYYYYYNFIYFGYDYYYDSAFIIGKNNVKREDIKW